MTYLSRVIFVDAPSSMGKDFFIDELVSRLTDHDPTLKVKVLRATDFVLKKEALSEQRKYTKHTIDENKLGIIYNGHLSLLEEIDHLLSDKVNRTDIVIVNRSILTTLAVNLWEDAYKIKRVRMTTNYGLWLDNLVREYNPTLVRLDSVVKSITGAVNVLLARIAERKENKEVDIEWLYTLVSSYRLNYELIAPKFTYSFIMNSGESEKFFNLLVGGSTVDCDVSTQFTYSYR